MKNLIENILEDQKIGLIDVGASGGLEPRWNALIDHLKCFLFEPDERSHKEIVSDKNKVVYPIALYNEPADLILNLCRKAQVSSVYHPKRSLLDLFPDKERWDIVGEVRLKAETLDNVINSQSIREECDFIKLDTQGSELSILEGSTEILSCILGIEVEVEFIQLYENQPVFGDVSHYLEKHGFSFIDFVRLVPWNRQGYDSERGQLVFADALFLKPPEKVISDLRDILLFSHKKAKNKLLRYISICLIYDKTDYVSFIYDNYAEEFDICKQNFSEYMAHHSHSLSGVSKSFIHRVIDTFVGNLKKL